MIIWRAKDGDIKGQSIKIKLVKGHWDFEIYGTAREDKKDGKDNTLKVGLMRLLNL